ncbi:hypothetical protein THAOC_36137, partial [Thalassiosira oceanica]
DESESPTSPIDDEWECGARGEEPSRSRGAEERGGMEEWRNGGMEAHPRRKSEPEPNRTGQSVVKVTHSARQTNPPPTSSETTQLVDNLLLRTSQMVKKSDANIVAYSGGVDSSLVAALVQRTFSDSEGLESSSVVRDDDNGSSTSGSVLAILGISPAVPKSQILMARKVADKIGIPLREVQTREGSDERYLLNDGQACYVCKTHLYSTLQLVAESALEIGVAGAEEDLQRKVVMFNGTNLEDTKDPTRLGLLAASEFEVHSPLDCVTKDQVRQAARHLGLPNWNSAASPCLRSRLAMNVLATEGLLKSCGACRSLCQASLGLG